MYVDLGEKERALDVYEQFLKLARDSGDAPGEARALFKMGEIRYELGQRSQAVAYVEAALKIYEQLEDQESIKLAFERLDSWR